jgi:hypothetical protein
MDDLERSQPKPPPPAKQKDPTPPKQVVVNPSASNGPQPKNTPLGRSDPLDGLIRR